MILNSGHTPGSPREFEEHEAQTADQVLSPRFLKSPQVQPQWSISALPFTFVSSTGL